MNGRDFLDTNILIYQLDRAEPRKSDIAHELIRNGLANRSACISFQVVHECLNTVLRKAEIPLGAADADRYLRDVLSPLCTIFASIPLYQRAIELQSRYRYGFYDSLIIAAAQAGECRRLITEDMQHGQKLDELTIHNPFLGEQS